MHLKKRVPYIHSKRKLYLLRSNYWLLSKIRPFFCAYLAFYYRFTFETWSCFTNTQDGYFPLSCLEWPRGLVYTHWGRLEAGKTKIEGAKASLLTTASKKRGIAREKKRSARENSRCIKQREATAASRKGGHHDEDATASSRDDGSAKFLP